MRTVISMRLKTRLVILGVIFSVFFISFKIIEPELEGSDNNRKAPIDTDYYVWDADGKARNVGATHHDDRINKLVDQYVKRYEIDWDMRVAGSVWNIAAHWVSAREIHPEYAPEIGAILHKLSKSKIVRAGVGHRGTQLKMSLILEGGQRAVFKPKWFNRDDIIEGKPYDGPDRHNGEIVAFHLNRILGYRRSPFVVGRMINLETEIEPVADQTLLNTFYVKGDNKCFYGKCLYCKGPGTGVCADETMMEGAVVLWLPEKWKLKNWRHPWGRTYRNHTKAIWETDNTYCDRVKHIPPYDHGPRLLDIIDAAVFDYLIGNADRHHYETFKDHPESMLVMLDSAKSFGNPHHDEGSILAPLYQCCRIRNSTWSRLNQLKDGALSTVLQRVTSIDPLSPLLAEAHYKAMDRRLPHILDIVNLCIAKYNASSVLVVDKYSSQYYSTLENS